MEIRNNSLAILRLQRYLRTDAGPRIRAYQIIQDQGRDPASSNEKPAFRSRDLYRPMTSLYPAARMLTDVLVVMVMMGRKVVSSEEAPTTGELLSYPQLNGH